MESLSGLDHRNEKQPSRKSRLKQTQYKNVSKSDLNKGSVTKHVANKNIKFNKLDAEQKLNPNERIKTKERKNQHWSTKRKIDVRIIFLWTTYKNGFH